MSAKDVIGATKVQPELEKQGVEERVEPPEARPIKTMDREKALEIGRRIMAENHELFKKLAQ